LHGLSGLQFPVLRDNQPNREVPPSGRQDLRLTAGEELSRDHRSGTPKYKRSRAAQKKLMIEEGCEFFKDDIRKLRYVGIYGDRRIKRMLKAALRWPVLPYPKRPTVESWFNPSKSRFPLRIPTFTPRVVPRYRMPDRRQPPCSSSQRSSYRIPLPLPPSC